MWVGSLRRPEKVQPGYDCILLISLPSNCPNAACTFSSQMIQQESNQPIQQKITQIIQTPFQSPKRTPKQTNYGAFSTDHGGRSPPTWTVSLRCRGAESHGAALAEAFALLVDLVRGPRPLLSAFGRSGSVGRFDVCFCFAFRVAGGGGGAKTSGGFPQKVFFWGFWVSGDSLRGLFGF